MNTLSYKNSHNCPHTHYVTRSEYPAKVIIDFLECFRIIFLSDVE